MKIAKLCALALCLTMVARLPAAAEEWRVANFMPVSHITHKDVLKPWADAVEAATGGALTARIYPGGSLGSGAEGQYRRVLDGVADAALGVQGYTSSQFPGTALVELPGMAGDAYEATRMLWRAHDGPLGREYRRIKVLGLWTNAPAVLITRDTPVRRLEDLQGLKVRVASQQSAHTIEAWGASPVSMEGPQIYTSLQTGVVDGVFIGASGLVAFRLYEVGDYVTTNLPTSVNAFFLAANRRSWRGLGEKTRAQVDSVSGRDFSLEVVDAFMADAERGMTLIRESDGVEVIELDEAQRKRFRKAAEPVWEETFEKLRADGHDPERITAVMRGD